MKIFLDTANLEQIDEAASWGLLDGVTTNPTLVSKEKMKFTTLIKKICKIVPGPVSVECVSTKADAMVKEARGHAKLADNVVVKVPICLEGLKAIKVLSQEGIQVNTTLIFSPNQALLAAKAGARFVSPFVGRLDDVGHDGMDLVADIVQLYQNYGFSTQVLVASVRHPMHVLEAAQLGADVVTVPHKVIMQMLKHPLTDVGIKKFNEDWEKVLSQSRK